MWGGKKKVIIITKCSSRRKEEMEKIINEKRGKFQITGYDDK